MLAIKFRLYPNAEEEGKLLWTIEVCGLANNRFLELYNEGEYDYAMLQVLLLIWKKNDKELRDVHSKVLKYELHRLFANLRALNGLRKRGRKVGKLRFKSSSMLSHLNLQPFRFRAASKEQQVWYSAPIKDLRHTHPSASLDRRHN